MFHFPGGGGGGQHLHSRLLQSMYTVPACSGRQKSQNARFPAFKVTSIITPVVHRVPTCFKQKPQAGVARSAAEMKKMKYLGVIFLLFFLSVYTALGTGRSF